MEQLCVYDIQSVNWKAVRAALRALPLHDHTEDWSDGSRFPGWVWLAHIGVSRKVVNEGVRAVRLEVADGHKCVVVQSVRGEFKLFANPHGKMVISRTPNA